MGILAKIQRRSLRAGDRVEVRSIDEILATLDTRGALEGLPFMPEMLAHCGKRFEVWKRADKTCDESNGGTLRRLKNTVHLKELRCDGAAHGGCDAGCLLFWKEQWLKRIDFSERSVSIDSGASAIAPSCTLDTLTGATHGAHSIDEADPGESFSCQATEISEFSSPLPWWNPGQYLRDLVTGNVSIREFLSGMFIGAFNKIQHFRSESEFQSLSGINGKTPQANLNLSPGDLVQIKSRSEIRQTLSRRGKNCGLSFRPDMISYCEGQYRVLRRVKKIIRPDTGKMICLGENCVILDGVVCTGIMKRFCPRKVYTYWRDIWLTKLPETAPACIQAEEPATSSTDDEPLPEPSSSSL
jgi:hypothetical protein